jgi:ABC-type multidrug transport system fused ATPase/permease subunit
VGEAVAGLALGVVVTAVAAVVGGIGGSSVGGFNCCWPVWAAGGSGVASESAGSVSVQGAVTVDVHRLAGALASLPLLWARPLQLDGALCVLRTVMGTGAAVLALCCLLLLLCVSAATARRMPTHSAAASAAQDAFATTLAEAAHGAAAVKAAALEPQLLLRARAEHAAEMSAAWREARLNAQQVFTAVAAPVLCSVVALGADERGQLQSGSDGGAAGAAGAGDGVAGGGGAGGGGGLPHGALSPGGAFCALAAIA